MSVCLSVCGGGGGGMSISPAVYHNGFQCDLHMMSCEKGPSAFAYTKLLMIYYVSIILSLCDEEFVQEASINSQSLRENILQQNHTLIFIHHIYLG